MKKYLPGVLALLAVLAVLVLVPASPALMVDAPAVLYASSADAWGSPAGLVITAYGLTLALGAALAIPLIHGISRKQNGTGGIGLALVSGACALCVSHWLFCALRWGYVINDLGESPLFLLTFWKGGYTMYGAILGGLLGTFLYARVYKQPVPAAMDAVLTGGALLMAAGRFAEHFTAQGRGTYVVNEALSMIPFVTRNEWGEAQVPVYIYEGLVAVAALIVMLVMLRRGRDRAGRAAETGLVIISAAQVMLDSWRGDELIRFGFVRLNMICAAVMLLCLMLLRVRRAIKAEGTTALWTVLRVVLLFLGAGVVLVVEFGLDGKMGITMNNTILYAIQAAAVTLMGATVLIEGRAARA